MFTTSRRVEFRDTDAAGIMHFSAFFPMMESAEHEMLRSLGISVMPRPKADGSHVVSWPRISVQCDYQAAARFEDLLDIGVSVAKIGSTSVHYRFDFTRESETIATGRITAVCCELMPDGLSKTPIPAELRSLLQKHA